MICAGYNYVCHSSLEAIHLRVVPNSIISNRKQAIMWCDLGMSGFFLLLLKLKDHPYDGSSDVGIHFKSLVDPFPLYGHDTMIKLVENQKITQ